MTLLAINHYKEGYFIESGADLANSPPHLSRVQTKQWDLVLLKSQIKHGPRFPRGFSMTPNITGLIITFIYTFVSFSQNLFELFGSASFDRVCDRTMTLQEKNKNPENEEDNCQIALWRRVLELCKQHLKDNYETNKLFLKPYISFCVICPISSKTNAATSHRFVLSSEENLVFSLWWTTLLSVS